MQGGDVNTPSLTSTTSFSIEEEKEAEQAVFTEVSENGGESWTGPDSSTVVGLAEDTAASSLEIKP